MIKRTSTHITAAIVVLMFLLGYGSAKAAVVVTYQDTAVYMQGGCPPPFFVPPTPCVAVGGTALIAAEIIPALRAALVASIIKVEAATITALAAMVNKWLLIDLKKMEFDLASHWAATWATTVLDSLQDYSRQQTVKMADSSRMNYSNIDAQEMVKQQTRMQMYELESNREHRLSESAAVASTISGGYGRSNAFSRAMRQATDKEITEIGINKIGTPGANSVRAFESRRFQEYSNTFCDPQANGGRNSCGSSDEKFYNADTRPTQYIYNQLTLPVNPDMDTDGKMSTTLEHINFNLFGVPVAEPVAKSAVETAQGQREILERRSYLARHGAVRSVQNLITGWRMPGSNSGEWVKSLRRASGIPEASISPNPSYKETMHAMTVDRFNSGAYARNLISDTNNIEMEKLILDTLYLMQLRDYYELLERTALVLSMQVIMMSEEQSTSNAIEASPLQ